MWRSFQIGKLFGIPLRMHTSFCLLPAWLLLANGAFHLTDALFLLAGLAGVFGCVVLHELGHALTARFYGIGTESITLYPIGGVARLRRMSEKPAEEIVIALAGPAVNLVLAVVLAAPALLMISMGDTASGLAATVGQLVLWMWAANVSLLLFNLLPCFPMDGGRVLRALLAIRLGQLRATEIAVRVGLVMACLIAGLSIPFGSPMPLVLAVFVFVAGQAELMGVRRLAARREAERLIVPELVAVPVEPRPYPDVPFTGVAWDNRSRVWVRWHDGRPVAYWG